MKRIALTAAVLLAFLTAAAEAAPARDSRAGGFQVTSRGAVRGGVHGLRVTRISDSELALRVVLRVNVAHRVRGSVIAGCVAAYCDWNKKRFRLKRGHNRIVFTTRMDAGGRPISCARSVLYIGRAGNKSSTPRICVD